GKRYRRLAHEAVQFILPFYTITIVSGVVLLLGFIYCYPVFFGYMARLFRPVVFFYAIAFLCESILLFLYYYCWDRLCATENGKWVHLSLGALLNTNGVLIIFWANSWMSFMMSPAGVDAHGRFLGNIWRVVHTPIWHPLNIHRILASAMFSGVVIGAVAAYRFLRSRSESERAYYDWVGSVMMSIVVISLSLLPFAGYWFAQVIFKYRQRMGVTLMGGELSWLFVVQAMLIGAIFIVIAHYLWQGMVRMAGSERYYPSIKYLLMTLVVCFLVWSTPHTLPGTPEEFQAMGSAQHPVVGNYGIMAAKNTAINTIILTIGLCLVIYQRCNKVFTASWVQEGNIILAVLFAIAEVNILFLGVYGIYVPARNRVALALPQFSTALTAVAAGYGINWLMLRSAKSLGPIRWGKLPRGGAYALFALAILITLTMILMGYIRSSVRLDWHINEIMRDSSPWAATPPTGRAFGIIFLNLALFWGWVVLVLALVRKKWRAELLAPVLDDFSLAQEASMNRVSAGAAQAEANIAEAVPPR
ncbi:MAG TPA: cytochrome ubiquinol oxidase subunit I, partial [Nitrospiria bacterium]|nr:cytochrome ubiquinol oxidase subunit I [Nitrospiria bacterium]